MLTKHSKDIEVIMDDVDNLLENNKQWAARQIAKNPDYFLRMSTGQKPRFLWIGCSDSRVPPHQIIGLEPGDLFVHRNIANLVISTDFNCQSVINYAVCQLKVKHIMVVGHYGCGGIKYSIDNTNVGLLNPWITHIDDVHRLHRPELAKLEGEELVDKLVELNVYESCLNLWKNYEIQKWYKRSGLPKIHGCVYNIKNGQFKELNYDFIQIMKQMSHIYNIDL